MAPFLKLSQSEKLSEIKPPLVVYLIALEKVVCEKIKVNVNATKK